MAGIRGWHKAPSYPAAALEEADTGAAAPSLLPQGRLATREKGSPAPPTAPSDTPKVLLEAGGGGDTALGTQAPLVQPPGKTCS